MADFLDVARLSPAKVDEVADVYTAPVQKKSRSTSTAYPVERRMDRVWEHALKLADGDPRRLERLRDGSVIVHDRPRDQPRRH